MSDVADMLGLSAKAGMPSASEEAAKIMGDKSKNLSLKSGKKPKGMSREVFDLLGKDGLVPSIQGNVAVPNFKNKRINALKGKWVWTHITSTARHNNQPVFFHWIKADQTYADYPYAAFNSKFTTFEYNDEEYNSMLVDESWSRADTDELISVCHQFDMRWPVIADRVELSAPRPVEEMQARYYTVRMILKIKREQQQGTAVVKTEGDVINSGFNLAQERMRRHAQDMLFKKTKEDEQEESQLREELKAIDAALKKNKKAKVAQQPAAVDLTSATNPTVAGAASGTVPAVEAGSATSIPARSILDATPAGGVDATGKVVATNSGATASSTLLGPQPGLPALQSSRLFSGIVPPVTLTGGVGEIGVTRLDTGMSGAMLSKKMLQKMNLYLRELDIPENPLPTKAVCDLVEQVKHSTVTLLSLHNALGRKEKELQLLLNGADPAVVLKEEVAPAPRTKAAPRASQGGRRASASTTTTTTTAAAAPSNATATGTPAPSDASVSHLASGAIIKQEIISDSLGLSSAGAASGGYYPGNTAMDVDTPRA